MIILALSSYGATQNPSQGDSGRGTSAISGKIGLITNNVTIGSYLQFTSTGIFWNPAAGGGGGAYLNPTNTSFFGTMVVTNNGASPGMIDGRTVSSVTNMIVVFSENFLTPSVRANFGFQNVVGTDSLAMGARNTSTGLESFAIGLDNSSTGPSSFAIGIGAQATNVYSIAFGNDTHAYQRYSMVVGDGSSSASSSAENELTMLFQNGYRMLGGDFTVTGLIVNGDTILGANSGDTLTLNGITITAPNGLNINSGMLAIPTVGVVTNSAAGSGFYTQNTLFASNVVVRTTDGTSTISSGTNLTMTITAGSGAGTLKLEGLFTTRTNTLTGTPVMDRWFTNNANRASVRTAVTLPTTLTTYSMVGFFTISGGVTNKSYMSSYAGLAATYTNSFGPFDVDPFAFYIWTNLNTTAGTPTIDPTGHVEHRW